jgi:hypothetical protein
MQLRKKKRKYDKEEIEFEAILSKEKGRISEKLGKFTLDRANEIARSSFYTAGNDELVQALVDEGVMRVMEKFLQYYEEDKSAANLIITMIYSGMFNRITSLKWSDVYGSNTKGFVTSVDDDGNISKSLVRYLKDDNISKNL